MGRKKLQPKVGLVCDVKTRINQEHFDRLSKILANSPYKKMSELLRLILCEKPVTVYTVDQSLHLVMEELSRLRRELNAIGHNINQVTRQFHSTDKAALKLTYVIELAHLQHKVNEKMDEIIPIIRQLSQKWLQE